MEALERAAQVEVVEEAVVGNRHVAEPCEGAVDTCSGLPAVGQTFVAA